MEGVNLQGGKYEVKHSPSSTVETECTLQPFNIWQPLLTSSSLTC